MTHELAHAKQWHTLDVLISEMVTIICWFNPFAWLIKREVRYNLEYLADQDVITAGYDAQSYQYHLLGLAQHPSNLYLYNNFNMLHLKNRILMMNTKRTTRIGIIKYLMLAPLATILMIACSGEEKTEPAKQPAAPAKEVTKTVTETPKPAVEKAETATAENTGKVFGFAEVPPVFPGGQGELLKYLGKSVIYPESAQKNNIQGSVVCSFIINKDGSVCDSHIIRGVDPALDKEAIRVIDSMPKWAPGKQKGEAVRVRYTIPITFRLQ